VIDSGYKAEVLAKNEAKMMQAEALKKAREDRFKDSNYVQELRGVFQALQRGELTTDIDRQKLDDIEALIDFSKNVKETMDKGHTMVFDMHTSDVAAQVLTKPKKVS
jgi:ATP phosphoribosyltransferase